MILSQIKSWNTLLKCYTEWNYSVELSACTQLLSRSPLCLGLVLWPRLIERVPQGKVSTAPQPTITWCLFIFGLHADHMYTSAHIMRQGATSQTRGHLGISGHWFLLHAPLFPHCLPTFSSLMLFVFELKVTPEQSKNINFSIHHNITDNSAGKTARK